MFNHITELFVDRYFMENYLKYYIIQKICHFAFICSMIEFEKPQRKLSYCLIWRGKGHSIKTALFMQLLSSLKPNFPLKPFTNLFG